MALVSNFSRFLALATITVERFIYKCSIGYAFGFVFSLISDSLFLPMTVLGYWISNILGFILMHYGYTKLGKDGYSFQEHWKGYVLATSLYTLVIVALIYYEILPSADAIGGMIGIEV